MNLDEITPNSHTYKEQQKQLAEEENARKTEKVIKGTAVKKKKSVRKKFADLFFTEDIPNVKEYILYELLIPTIKDTIVEVIKNTADMMFYGKIRNNKKSGTGSYISYSSYSRPQLANRDRTSPAGRTIYSFDDIYLEDMGEANQVLDVLREIIEKYGYVTVADYFDAVGVTGNGYTDRSYGWTDLTQAYVARSRSGYYLEMPRCEQLKRN